MVATIGLHVYTSTNAGTESGTVTGIDLISADNATNTLGNRQTYPVVTATNSFEKHLRLKLEVAPANSISNIKFWTDGSGTANVLFRGKLAIGTGGATPGTGDSTPSATTMTADADAYSYTSGSKGTWDSGSYSTINHVTKALLLQLQPSASATPGNWSETLSYSYDEA